MSTYTLKVAGLTRELNICSVNENIDIAAFIMFSDVEMTIACATELLDRLPEFDVIFTSATKGIPLAYEMARQSGKNYVVAGKDLKVYMTHPISVDVNSITTQHLQKLFVSDKDVALLKDKRVLIIDDVISTGASLTALEKLVELAGGIIAAKAAVLAEGEAAERDDIVFLNKLPVFIKN